MTKQNSWFKETRARIIREECKRYSESLCFLFRAYKAILKEDFREDIASEKRNWTQGKLPEEYTYLFLMGLTRLEYNNAVEDENWNTNKAKIEQDGKEANILALATQILEKVGSNHGKSPGYDGKGPTDGTNKQLQSWLFQNPTNEGGNSLEAPSLTGATRIATSNPCDADGKTACPRWIIPQ